jgi:hypothetical protein
MFRRPVGHGIEPLTVWVDFQRDATNHFLKTNDAAHLVGDLGGSIEEIARMRVGCERAFDDADRREANQSGPAVVAFTVLTTG